MARVFDHLDGVPEDRFLSRVAREITRSPMWTEVPRNEFSTERSASVAGEVRTFLKSRPS